MLPVPVPVPVPVPGTVHSTNPAHDTTTIFSYIYYHSLTEDPTVKTHRLEQFCLPKKLP